MTEERVQRGLMLALLIAGPVMFIVGVILAVYLTGCPE